METRPRRRKSKRASGAFEGRKQVQKKIASPRITYNSQCQYDSSANEDMFMIELGESASKRVTGKPMKKLIAEEMLDEVESKRKSPSIIARLMGLDGMPSPQQISRHQRRLSESSRQRKEKIDTHRTVQLFVDQSRRNYMEYHEVHDVNEDLEASHIANRRFSSRWSTKSGPSIDMPEVAALQHKYLEATHRSTDEKFQSSKGFVDTLEVLEDQESNDELLLKCLQERDSFFSKHLLDLQVDTSSSVCSHIAVLKPATSANSEGTAILRKPEREGSWHHDINLQRKREDGHLFHLQNPHAGHSYFKSPMIHVKGKEGNNLPTRIVVLKPNCGKTHCDVTSVQYPSEEKKLPRRLNFETGKTGFAEMKNSSKYVNSHSKEAREIAKEITTRMKNSHGPLNVRKDLSLIYSDVVGYATDESSCDVYENDSASELDTLKQSSGSLYSRNDRSKSSSSATFESSVSREARKRLSERWKMTQSCQDIEIVSKGNTLGEMLSLPDRETEAVHLDTIVTPDGASDKFGGRRIDVKENPLGISSRDGWKDVYISSRSRSLSPLGSQIQGLSTRHEIVAYNQNLRPRELVNCTRPVDRSRIKSWDGSQCQTEEISFNEIRSGRKKHRSSCRKATGANDTLQEAIFCKMMSTNVECNLSEQLLLASEMPVSKDAISVIDSAKHTEYTEHESVTSESSVDLIHKTFTESNETLFLGQDASDLQEMSVQLTVPSQCPHPEPESSESSRDGGHPSPVSVLEEVTFTEDSLSGSECLDLVSAKISDLRKKIEQLKMKPESYADLAEDHHDVWHPVEEKCTLMSPSWESSYIGDILMDSGFEQSDPDAFIATCHSPDCPLSPSVFENLEKKYSDEVFAVPRYARRLLFDRVNLAMLDILRHYVDPYPWLKPKRVANFVCQKQDVGGALHRLLADQDSVANRDTSERILEREMHWLDVSDDINVIGKEIEKSLVDDLITEIIMM